MNKIMIIGNLGDDVKVHHFDENNCLGRFPVATSESYTARSGEKITETEWHNVVVRNRLAETCEKYLRKGNKVFVEGRIRSRKWEDNGITRYTTEIIASNIEFLTPPSESGNSGNNYQSQEPRQYESSQPQTPSEPAAVAQSVDSSSEQEPDDLPF